MTTALYLYGVTPADSRRDIELGLGVGRRPVAWIDHDGLTALVSDIDTRRFKPKKDDLLAHARVLEKAATGLDVIPMRFGMTMPDRKAVVEQFLDPRASGLRDLLHRLAGCVEMQVKASYAEDQILAAVVSQDAAVRRLRSRGQNDYMSKVRLGEEIARGIERRRQHETARIVDRLRRHARAHASGPLASEYAVANLAFLTPRSSIEDFAREVDRLRSDRDQLVSFRVLGPMPPYSFIDHGSMAVA